MSETSGNKSRPGVYPTAYGNEEEGCINDLRFPNATLGADASRALDLYQSNTAQSGAIQWSGDYGTDGARGYIDHDHPEHATAECATVEDLVTHTQGHQLFWEAIAMLLAQMPHYPGGVGIQQRVVDGHGNTWGSHDNFGLPWLADSDAAKDTLRKVYPVMLAHAVTRPFITGAGYALPDRHPVFSQKMHNLKHISYGDSQNSIYRMEPAERRAEVRCGDILISPDALRQRIGGCAIAWAVGAVRLGAWCDNFWEKYNYPVWDTATMLNEMPLNPDGSIKWSQLLDDSAVMQLEFAETFMSGAMARRAGEQPPELMAIAREQYAWSEEMRAVIRGKLDWTIFLDRADWAAKHYLTVCGMERDRAKGIPRAFGDQKALNSDRLYDLTHVTRDRKTGQIAIDRLGTGYKWRATGRFRTKFDEAAVRAKIATAPQNTRAHLRGRLIREFGSNVEVGWNRASFLGGGRLVYYDIRLDDPRQTAFTDEQEDILEAARYLISKQVS